MSGCVGFRCFVDLLLFLENNPVSCVVCMTGRIFGCSLQCYVLLLISLRCLWLYWLMASFSGISWMSVKEKVFCLSYFEVKLQKPGGLVCQGNLLVYLILRNLN